jgi:CDP-paratose 2-epimerase
VARVLITGGAGFIGSRLVSRCVGRGDEVTVLDDLSRAGSADRLRWLHDELGRGSFEFAEASVAEAGRVEQLCRGRDVVAHLAGQVAVTDSLRDPRTDFEANVLGTLNLLEGVRRGSPEAVFLHASTNKVYGNLSHLRIQETPTRYRLPERPDGIAESEPLDPRTPYGCSNAAADLYALDYARVYGLRTVVFRQSCVYGPGQLGSEDQGWVAWLLRAALRGESVTIFGDGKQVRDLLYVEDLLDVYDAACAVIERSAGRAYNVGGGPDASLSVWYEFRDYLSELAGVEPLAQFEAWRSGDQRVYVSDARRAASELDWRPRVSLREGLKRLCLWLMEGASSGTHRLRDG